jgi:hypothetical protein
MRYWLGWQLERKIISPTFLRGRGSPNFKKNMRLRPIPVSVWHRLQNRNSSLEFEALTRMNFGEFCQLLEDLSYLALSPQVKRVGVSLLFEDKLLLLWIWLVKYPDYSELGQLFGVSVPVVCRLIHTLHPLLVHHFIRFIPNQLSDSPLTSVLSDKIVAIVDSTIHAISKPRHDQHQFYNNHYQRHGIMTHLLIEFSGLIIGVQTNVPGRVHDAAAAHHNTLFMEILGEKLKALGDPGYAGVPFVVAGLKSNQVSSISHQVFDRISRSEQVIVEHVNRHIKQFTVLSKHQAFTHQRQLHVGSVFLICGWYNWMLLNFDKYSEL